MIGILTLQLLNKNSYYDILNVSEDASQAELKKVFRKMSMKYHPDRAKTPEEKEQFQQKQFELNEIMNILGNQEKRQVYDNAIHHNMDPIKALEDYEQQKITQDYDFLNPNSPNFDPSKKVNVQEKANETNVDLFLSFLDAYHGKQFTYTYNQTVICPYCKASGAKQAKECPHCHGKGRWTEEIEYKPGVVKTVEHVCEICRGNGKQVQEECPHCHGSGVILQENQIPVIIMPGIYNGSKLVFDQQGNCNVTDFKQSNGDLVINVQVEQQFNEWRREGQNLLSDIQITLQEALYGFSKVIYLPDGKTFKVEKQTLTQPEEKIVYEKMGFNQYDDKQVGDMILQVHVVLNENDKKFVRQEIN